MKSPVLPVDFEVKCAGCNSYFLLNKVREHNNGYYCLECYQQLKRRQKKESNRETKCAFCGKVLTPYDSKIQDSGKSYCPVCYHKSTTGRQDVTAGKANEGAGNASEKGSEGVLEKSSFVLRQNLTTVKDTNELIDCPYCSIVLTRDALKQDARGKIPCLKCGRDLSSRLSGRVKEDYNAIAQLFKCLGDPCRVKIIESLSARELCVFEFVEMTGYQYSAISYHLKMLKDLGLVRSYERGNFVVYSLTDKGVAVHEFIKKSGNFY